MQWRSHHRCNLHVNGSQAAYRVASVHVCCIECVVQLLTWDAVQNAGQAGLALRLQSNASLVAKGGNRAGVLHVAQMARVVLIYTKSDAALSCIPQ